MRKIRFQQNGGNRGAGCILDGLARLGADVAEVHVFDPKPGRAAAHARLHAARGSRVRADEMRCEDVPPDLDPEVPAVVAVDVPSAMAMVVHRQKRRSLLLQGMMRASATGPVDPPVFGVTMGAFPERAIERSQVESLCDALARVFEPQSSAVMREDPFNSTRMQRARIATGLQTARSLVTLERTKEEDSLAALFHADVRYPLIIHPREGVRTRARREQALDLAARSGERAAVALVGDDGVDFYAIDLGRRRARVRMSAPIRRPVSAPSRIPRPVRGSSLGVATVVGLTAVGVGVGVAAIGLTALGGTAAAFTD